MRTAFFVAATATIASTFVASVGARAQVGGFPDVPKNHWASDPVQKLAQAGILTGYPEGQKPASKPKSAAMAFNGDKPVTRYELAATLYRFVQYIERADKQKRGKSQVQAAPKNGAEAIARLISGGYLPATTPLAKNGSLIVTANQLSEALAQIMLRINENKTPITPDSRRDDPIEMPQGRSGA